MKLLSTRNSANMVSALDAVLLGIADDGGLFVPEMFPKLSLHTIEKLGSADYASCAAYILSQYFELTEEELLNITKGAYANFDHEQVVPIRKIGGREYVMELFHGPTLAFKDMALQVLPRLMSEAIRQNNSKDVLILTATSGDTGKAALEGFKNIDRTKIAVIYPSGGVSDMQRLQMVTSRGDNVYVCAVKGNFDDAQTAVKKMFADPKFCAAVASKDYQLSSANSINFGRLAPQIVYYIYTYAKLAEQGEIRLGEKINFTVPTGNFGNILAGYYAKRMGLPIEKLFCASNKNNVLTDFFDSGQYMARRTFFKTISPSMDILISSNLERLIFEVVGRDCMQVCELMGQLQGSGEYSMGMGVSRQLAEDFYADSVSDQSTLKTIREVYEQCGYLMDPHTAVAKSVHDRFVKSTRDDTPNVIVSTASPFKFVQDVLFAVTGKREGEPFQAARMLSQATGLEIPAQISSLETDQIRFSDESEKEQLSDRILEFLNR